MNKVAIEYTSASTALNQKLSEKVKAKAPTKEAPKTAIELLLFISVKEETIFLSKIELDQNRNKMVNALEKTDIMFTIKAILSGLTANIGEEGSNHLK